MKATSAPPREESSSTYATRCLAASVSQSHVAHQKTLLRSRYEYQITDYGARRYKAKRR